MKKEEMYKILDLTIYNKRIFRHLINAQQELERAGLTFNNEYDFVFNILNEIYSFKRVTI